MVCSFLVLVFDMIGLHIVFAYFKMGQVITLNVKMISSFYLTHFVEVSTLKMLSIYFTLLMLIFMCFENASFGSRVITRIFGCFVVGSV